MLLDAEKCVGCGACVPICPTEAISVLGTASINGDKCQECKACIAFCVVDAISEGEV
ncbi:MAG: 4Fe-4S binding protein [Candidatus Hydrothermarchaeales archaeon]